MNLSAEIPRLRQAENHCRGQVQQDPSYAKDVLLLAGAVFPIPIPIKRRTDENQK